jgi:HAD superfamily hydrolase (TIGR01450 family)
MWHSGSPSLSSDRPIVSPSPIELSYSELRRRHAAILFDAYGVLVDADGALPGAAEAIAALERGGQPFLVVTNDASRSGAQAAARLNRLGIGVRAEHILSSGMLIAQSLRAHGLDGARVVVLGTDDSHRYVSESGASIVTPSVDEPADAVVIADEGGFDILDMMDDVLSMLVAAYRQGQSPLLLLANPDLIYPSGGDRFGFTAGSLAAMLENALALVTDAEPPKFEVLGKPSPIIFTEALTRIGTRDAVMIGDTLHTDVAGAQSVGIASAIALTGVTTRKAASTTRTHVPTYLLPSLA